MPEWIEIFVRSLFMIATLFLLTKMLGKIQLADLSFFEYITGISIGNIAGEISMDIQNNIWHGLIGMVVWTAVPLGVGMISMKNKKFRNIVEGKGTIFIKDGKVLEENLKKEKYTIDELLSQLREKDVFSVSDVEFAILEPTGSFSVLLKKENQPLTPKDLDMQVPSTKESQVVIMDGNIMDEPLATVGLSRRWLKTALEKQGVLLENVFLGQVDSTGDLFVDLYDDKIQLPSPQNRPLLLSTIKKCQADLESFALETESEEAKKMYAKNAQELQNVIDQVDYLLNS